MANYTQLTDFSAKDSLSDSDSEKIILGADIDDELAAIATAIATKADSTAVASLTASNTFALAVDGAYSQSYSNTSTGTSAQLFFKLANNAAHNLYLGLSGGNYSATEWTNGPTGEQAFLGTSGSVPISIATNSTERMRIAGDGSTINLTATAVQVNGYNIESPRAVKTADTARSSTTTYADDPHLTVTAAAAGHYALRARLYFNATSAGTGGIKFQIATSGSVTSCKVEYKLQVNGGASLTIPSGAASAVNTTLISAAAISTSATRIDYLEIEGALQLAASQAVTIQWAQNSSDANAANLLTGSWLVLERLG